MPPTAINLGITSAQRLVALLVLHFLEAESGLSEADLLRRIRDLGGEGFWVPNKGTVSKVVRGLIAEGYVEGRWVNPEGRRRWALSITDEGRIHLRVLKREFRKRLDAGRRFFDQAVRELYGG
jgi:DNA-binding PadR family transcriptional regulator